MDELQAGVESAFAVLLQPTVLAQQGIPVLGDLAQSQASKEGSTAAVRNLSPQLIASNPKPTARDRPTLSAPIPQGLI